MQSSNPPPTLPFAVTQALDSGNLVEAIKLLRASGMGPADLKESVEAYMRNATPRFQKDRPMAMPEQVDVLRGLSPGQVPESRFGFWWLAVLVAIASGAILMGWRIS